MRIDATSAGLVLSTIGTLVVIVGAIAALQQLRHIRHGNELATLTALTAQYDAPAMLEARAFIRTGLAEAMLDPEFLAELRSSPLGPRAQQMTIVADFFELIGLYVRYGALSPAMTFTLWGPIALRQWDLMRDAIAVVREDRTVLGFFEDFAMRSEQWSNGPRFQKSLARLTRDARLRLDRP